MTPERLFGCDCCSAMVPRDQIAIVIAYGIETGACCACRGVEPEDDDPGAGAEPVETASPETRSLRDRDLHIPQGTVDGRTVGSIPATGTTSKKKLSHPSWYGGMENTMAADHPKTKTLPELLADAALVRKICRQICIDDGVDPDDVGSVAYGHEFKNYELHTASVGAVLRALKAIAS